MATLAKRIETLEQQSRGRKGLIEDVLRLIDDNTPEAEKEELRKLDWSISDGFARLLTDAGTRE